MMQLHQRVKEQPTSPLLQVCYAFQPSSPLKRKQTSESPPAAALQDVVAQIPMSRAVSSPLQQENVHTPQQPRRKILAKRSSSAASSVESVASSVCSSSSQAASPPSRSAQSLSAPWSSSSENPLSPVSFGQLCISPHGGAPATPTMAESTQPAAPRRLFQHALASALPPQVPLLAPSPAMAVDSMGDHNQGDDPDASEARIQNQIARAQAFDQEQQRRFPSAGGRKVASVTASPARARAVASFVVPSTPQERKKAKRAPIFPAAATAAAASASTRPSYVFSSVPPVFPFDIVHVISSSDSPHKKWALQFTIDHLKHPYATDEERAAAAAAIGCDVADFDMAMNNMRLEDRCVPIIEALFAGTLKPSAQADPRHGIRQAWLAPTQGDNAVIFKREGKARRAARLKFEELRKVLLAKTAGAAGAAAESAQTPVETPHTQHHHSAPANSTSHRGIQPESARQLHFNSASVPASETTASGPLPLLAAQPPLLASPNLAPQAAPQVAHQPPTSLFGSGPSSPSAAPFLLGEQAWAATQAPLAAPLHLGDSPPHSFNGAESMMLQEGESFDEALTLAVSPSPIYARSIPAAAAAASSAAASSVPASSSSFFNPTGMELPGLSRMHLVDAHGILFDQHGLDANGFNPAVWLRLQGADDTDEEPLLRGGWQCARCRWINMAHEAHCTRCG